MVIVDSWLTPSGQSPVCIARPKTMLTSVVAARLDWKALLPAACHSDNRISLAELNQIERELSDRPAVPVEHQELALTDFRP